MYRCGIPRKDGTTRIGVLCEICSNKALGILLEEGKKFIRRPFIGDVPCEACLSEGQVVEEKDHGFRN